jgi:hypothetical protein
VRIRRYTGVVILAAGLGLAAAPTGAGAAGTDAVPPLVTSVKTVTDPVGDAVDMVTNAVGGNDRADITSASVEWAPGWIRMKVQVKTLTDPLKDPAWSDMSDAEWALDTNLDGKEDYSVEFATSKGELYGAVFDATKPNDKSKCDADSASYSPQDGYTLVIDPACIGNPKAMGFAVAMFFDTNPKDDKNPMASDRVPDQGFVPIGAPGQPDPGPGPVAPAASPAPGAASPPRAAAGSTVPGAAAPDAFPRPHSGAVPAAPRAAAGSPSAGGAGSSVSGAPRGAAAGSATTGTPGAAPAAPASTNLARTGSASETRGLFGLGLMLLGAGVVVMTRPTRRAGIAAG